jgi:hypothetical protein
MAFMTDKECIKEAARDLIDELEGSIHLNIDRSLVLERLECVNGWITTVAAWDGNPSIAISIDRVPGFETPKFWTGFFGSRKQIEAFVRKLPVADRHDLELSDRDFQWDGKKYRLLEPPSGKKLRHPVMEHYRRYDSYFGIYDVNSSRHFDSGRSADFVKRVVKTVDPSNGTNVSKRSPGAAGNAYKKYLKSTELHIGPKHKALQERFKSFLRKDAATDIDENSGSVDLWYRDRTGSVTLCEVKPCTYQTARFAIRTAIGQLLDYSQPAKGKIPKLMIVVEERPAKFDIELATGNGFCIAYPDGADFTLIPHQPNTA